MPIAMVNETVHPLDEDPGGANLCNGGFTVRKRFTDNACATFFATINTAFPFVPGGHRPKQRHVGELTKNSIVCCRWLTANSAGASQV